MTKNKKNIVFFLLIYALAVLAPLHTTLEDLSKIKENGKNCELCDWIVSQTDGAKQISFSPSKISFFIPFAFAEVEKAFYLPEIYPTNKTQKGLFFRGPPIFTI